MDDWHSSGPHPILRRTSCVQLVWLVFLALTHSLPQASADSPNLTSQVDQLLADPAIAVPVSPAHDAALARRLYLDLCGMRPTLDQISNYLSDSNPDRYPALVDRLIASPEFHEHWAERFDVMLMERRANTHVPQDQWTQWLRDQISADRPLHHWMADLIVADGYPADQRPAARFLLDRGADPHLITRDIGRIYFGRDLQCAQCHDHPSIDSYLQSDYHGLLGFVGSLGMVEVTEAEKKIQVIVEKSANEAAFESVFDRGKFRRVLPQVPFGDEAVKFVSIPGEDYLQPEVAGYPQRPAQSRRKQLAEFIRSGEQPEFNRNLANRLFGMLFGRSLIEPADLVHSENPPLHPELLDLLVDELRHSNFSLRTFLQQLVLSRSYRLGEAPIRYEQVAVEANEFLTTIQPPWFAATVETATATLPELERSLAMVSQQLETADHDYRTAQAAFEPIEAERLQALAAVDAARTTYSQSLDARNKATAERDAASSAVNAIHDKISKLQLASDAATGAIAAVGEDAEIAAAVAMFKQKVEKLNAELPGLQQAFDAKQQASAAAEAKANTDRDELLAAQTTADAVDGKHAAVRQPLLAARLLCESLRTERTRLGSHKRAVTDLIELDSAYKALEQLESKQTSLEAMVAQAEEASTKLQTQLSNDQAKTNEMLADLQRAEADHQQAIANTDALNQRIETLKAAEQSLQRAANAVTNPEKLTEATEEISTNLLSLTEQQSRLGEQQKAAEIALANAKQLTEMQQSRLAEAKNWLTASQTEITTAQQNLHEYLTGVDKQQMLVTKALQQVQGMLGDRILSSRLTPLTPEQMGWSFLNVTGVYGRYVDKHLAELEKESPATDEQKNDAKWLAMRQTQAVRRARAELQGNINHFINLYGAGAGQPQADFFATADQALYASNGGALFDWAGPAAGNVTERIVQETDNRFAAKKLFLGLLGREPTEPEYKAVDEFMTSDPAARSRLAQELVWGLMAGAEFRFKN